MKASSLIALIIISVLLFSSCHKNIKESTAYHKRDATWQDFRSHFPYNIQVVGVEKFDNDKSFNIVISEPPPSFDMDAFNNLINDNNGVYEIKTHPIGIDGWVKDIVVSVYNDDDPNEFVAKMNNLIYGTDYKSYYLNLPLNTGPALYLAENQNLNVTALELKKWLVTDGETFHSNDSKDNFTLTDLSNQSKTGVFYSEKDGLVVWAFKQNNDIGDENAEMRQFFVDSDLILGAIAKDNFLYIIGRERVNNIVDMPPLRVETARLLAHANKDQLSQSYERMSFGAGKIEGGKDWAPIYLSDELKNTEYGSLLNITDQMLKSWSENGLIKYTNFGIVNPSYWIFSNGALDNMGSGHLTYNWNTKGAVYELSDENYDYVALNRIGSLPVSYIPGGEGEGDFNPNITKAEASAYNYFSSLNNPYLIRVNQYAALYQIFSKYHITCAQDDAQTETSSDTTSSTMADTTALGDSQYQVVSDLALSTFKTMITESDSEYTARRMKNIFWEILDPKSWHKSILAVGRIKKSLKIINDSLGNDALTKLAIFVANPRLSTLSLSTRDDSLLWNVGSYINQNNSAIGDLYIDNKKALFDQYISSNTNAHGKWIKTPSAVLSWSTRDSMFMTGGHNIDSRIVPITVDKSLPEGEYRIVEENGIKTVKIAEGDVGKISSSFLRKVEDSPDRGLLTMPVTEEGIPPRPRQDVILTTNRNVRGLSPNHITIEKKGVGYVINNKHIMSANEMIDELVRFAEKEKPDHLSVTFKSITADEANAILHTTENKLAKECVLDPGDIFNVTSHKYDFDRMDFSIHDDVIEVNIPAKEYESNKVAEITNQTQSVTVYVKNIFGQLKDRARNVYLALKSRLRNEAVPGSIDFFREFKKDLIANGVKETDISIERNDSIIVDLIPVIHFNDYEEDNKAA